MTEDVKGIAMLAVVGALVAAACISAFYVQGQLDENQRHIDENQRHIDENLQRIDEGVALNVFGTSAAAFVTSTAIVATSGGVRVVSGGWGADVSTCKALVVLGSSTMEWIGTKGPYKGTDVVWSQIAIANADEIRCEYDNK